MATPKMLLLSIRQTAMRKLFNISGIGQHHSMQPAFIFQWQEPLGTPFPLKCDKEHMEDYISVLSVGSGQSKMLALGLSPHVGMRDRNFRYCRTLHL